VQTALQYSEVLSNARAVAGAIKLGS
jgi:hypothetical protein